VPNRDGNTNGRNRWLLAGSAGLAGIAGLAAYAYAVEPRRLQVVRYRLGVAELPAQLAGVRIVHLTDFHLGMRPTRWRTLRRAVAATVAEAPDLIAVTGDMTHDGVWTRGGDLFARLAAAAPTVAVLGNHDHHASPAATEEIVARLEQVGVRVLRNTHATVAVRGGVGELVVVAVDDPHLDYDNLGAAMSGLSITPEPDRPALLLGHVPDIVDQAPADRFFLTLAGHTHGGQVRLSPLKRFSPLEVPMIAGGLDSRYPRGTHVVNGNPLFVSNGLGLSGAPFRFLAPPQVARFTLERGVVGDASPDDPERYFAPDGD
jgi:predicted MPP superfamily phosphohydrolase